MKKLKSCPFCGGPAGFYEKTADIETGICCITCGVHFPYATADRWNTRADNTWISVKDRLPEREGIFLTYMSDNAIRSRIFDLSDGFSKKFDAWPLSVVYVTHWQPLPEPPEEKQKCTEP